MSRMYNSLKEAVQETLQRSNTSPIRIAQVKDKHATGLTDEIEEFASIVADRIGRLKAAVRDDEVVFAGERAHAKQVIANLSANITSLEDKLNEAQDNIQSKDSAIRKAEESLTGKIQNSQNEREESTAGRDGGDLNSKADTTVKELNQLEAAVAEAVNRAKLAEKVAESSEAQIIALKGQLSETERIVRTKDASTQELVEHLHGKIQELECQVRNNEELLANRERQVQDFKLKLTVLKNWIEGMSPFFRQAEEALAVTDAKETGTDWPSEPLKKEKLTAIEPIPRGVTSKAMDTAQETVPGKFFDRMTVALTHVLGPRASIIVRGHVAALGESMEEFPKARAAELVEIVSQELVDENLKVGFREVLGDGHELLEMRREGKHMTPV